MAQELAAEQVDLYLTWGEPPELVKEKIAQVRAKAAAHGRTVRFRYSPARDRPRNQRRGVAGRRAV